MSGLAMLKLIVLFLLAIVGLALQSQAEELPDDWKVPHYKVFGNDAEVLTPEKTYEILVGLVKLYQDRNDELSLKRRAKAEELVAEKELNPERCSQESSDRLSQLFAAHALHKINVIPYIKKIRLDRVRFCQAKFSSELAEVVEQLNPKDREDVVEMIQFIHDSHQEQNEHMEMFTPRINLVDGIIQYLNRHVGDLSQHEELKSHGGQHKLEYMFNENVGALCKRVDRIILPRAKIYKRLVYDEELLRELDQTTKDWVARAFVCEDLVWKTHSLVEEMHQILTKGRPKPGEENKRRGFRGYIKSLVHKSE